MWGDRDLATTMKSYGSRRVKARIMEKEGMTCTPMYCSMRVYRSWRPLPNQVIRLEGRRAVWVD